MIVGYRRSFSNITNLNNKGINLAKSIVQNVSKKSTGIPSKTLAVSSKDAANSISNATGDLVNSFKTGNKVGYNVHSYKRAKRIKKVKGPELPFEGGIDTISKPRKVKHASPNKTELGNESLDKLQSRKQFERRKLRISRKDQTGPEELVKQTNTKGASRIMSNGMVIPGFGI